MESVPTGAEGLERIARGGIDVVVLDHYLTDETGLAVLERLKDVPDAPGVVYVTGSAETAIAVDALRLGAADYVHKSVDENFFALLGRAVDQASDQVRYRREKERAEREVREARDRAEMLLSEVNHRVANSLAMVGAVIRMQANATPHPDIKAVLAETEARIAAVVGLHRKLYTSDNIRRVDLHAYLDPMARDLERTMRPAGSSLRLSLELEPFELSTDRAISVGMIITELLTNAYKYAYPSEAEGEVRLRLKRMDEKTALIAVEDDGLGWKGTGDIQGTGIGSRIVQSMARSLGTALAYDDLPRGTRAHMTISGDL